MKKLFPIIVIVLLGFFGCDQEEQITSSEIYVFVDVSDEINKDITLLKQGIPGILNKMRISTTEGGLSGGLIKFFILAETSSSPYKSIFIEKAQGGMLDEKSNKYVRGEEVKKFKDEFEKIMSTIITDFEWIRSTTKIYQQLCREVNRMKFSKADQKIIILYSDMLENSKLFSFFYKNDKIANTKNDLNEVKRWIESDSNIQKAYENILSIDCEFPDLSDIEFYIVSNRNVAYDEKINLAEKFWTSLFRLKNAKRVHYGAELRFYD